MMGFVKKKKGRETGNDLIGDFEVKNFGLLENLNSKRLAGSDVLSELDLAKIAFAQSPSKLVFAQLHSLAFAFVNYNALLLLLLLHFLSFPPCDDLHVLFLLLCFRTIGLFELGLNLKTKANLICSN